MTKFDMYKTLGLSVNASLDEIKEAYRRLVKKYHPDLSKSSGSSRCLSQVIQAYKNLTVAKRTGSIVDFPVKNVKKTAEPQNHDRNIDIFKIGNLLETGKTVGIRAFAARSLGNSGKRTAYAFLRKALNDSSDMVVKTAVEAIGCLRIQQCYGELSSLYSRGSKEIRETVLAAVEKIGAEGAFKEIVVQAASDPDMSIRINARNMLHYAQKVMPNG